MQNAAQQHLAHEDEVLKNLILNLPFPEIASTKNVFHDLMGCIIEQQIHYRSSKKTFHKMLDQAGIVLLSLENFNVFEEKALAGRKLSLRKYETMGRIIEFFKSRTLDWKEMADEEVREVLSQIKGVGSWTIDMILMYTLDRPDVFPTDDFHPQTSLTSILRSRFCHRFKDPTQSYR